MPRILREIIRQSLSVQPDMQIVGEFTGAVSLLPAVDQSGADFVIVGVDEMNVDDVRFVLQERPHIKILAVGGDGKSAALYELRPNKVSLGEVSPDSLVRVIREAADDTVSAAHAFATPTFDTQTHLSNGNGL